MNNTLCALSPVYSTSDYYYYVNIRLQIASKSLKISKVIFPVLKKAEKTAPRGRRRSKIAKLQLAKILKSKRLKLKNSLENNFIFPIWHFLTNCTWFIVLWIYYFEDKLGHSIKREEEEEKKYLNEVDLAKLLLEDKDLLVNHK